MSVHADKLNSRGNVCGCACRRKAKMGTPDNERQEKREDWKTNGRAWRGKREMRERKSTINTGINHILLFLFFFSSSPLFCSLSPQTFVARDGHPEWTQLTSFTTFLLTFHKIKIVLEILTKTCGLKYITLKQTLIVT